jgi:hypothetical protein
MVAEDRCLHMIQLFSYFIQNSYYILKMWHSFLYHESSYVWNLILAHIWFASKFSLNSGVIVSATHHLKSVSASTPIENKILLSPGFQNDDNSIKEFKMVRTEWPRKSQARKCRQRNDMTQDERPRLPIKSSEFIRLSGICIEIENRIALRGMWLVRGSWIRGLISPLLVQVLRSQNMCSDWQQLWTRTLAVD